MKKLLAIVLLLFYLPAISGVAISKHFCCGKIASVKIQLAAEQCGHHSQSEDKNCCNDISHFFKIHAPQQISVSNISCKAPVLPVPVFMHALSLIFVNESPTSVNNNFLHSPPLRTTSPLFLSNSVFLI
jgi:hypothetical protein